MTPTLPPKSPRMSLKHPLHIQQNHPIVPIVEPQHEVIINQHRSQEGQGGGIEYHPLGKKREVPNEADGRQGGGGGQGSGVQTTGDGLGGVSLSRQPHQDEQETGPVPLPTALTAQHHIDLSPGHQHHSTESQEQGGPRQTRPPPPLQIRSLNTNNNNQPPSKSAQLTEGKVKGDAGDVGGKEGGGGGGVLSRFKTTFLSKNKSPISKTWSKQSFLDELESMAPTSPQGYGRSVPVSPADLEGGGIRRIRNHEFIPRARSVYASPIALAQFRALPPMDPQGEIMVPPR